MAAAPDQDGFRRRGWFIATRAPMDPNGSIRGAGLEQEVHEAEEQLALGGDVELVVHALLMVLDRVDAELEPARDLRRGIAEQDEPDDVTLARRQVLVQIAVNRIPIVDRRQSGILAAAAARGAAE